MLFAIFIAAYGAVALAALAILFGSALLLDAGRSKIERLDVWVKRLRD